MSHDAHIVEKRRHGGDRDGEVVYYAVGPTRSGQTGMTEAQLDVHHLTLVRHQLMERQAEVRRLEQELSEERARGAVLTEAAQRFHGEAAATVRNKDGVPHFTRPATRDAWIALGRALARRPSPAVTALLELVKRAETSRDVALKLSKAQASRSEDRFSLDVDYAEALTAERVAVDRWREVKNG